MEFLLINEPINVKKYLLELQEYYKHEVSWMLYLTDLSDKYATSENQHCQNVFAKSHEIAKGNNK